MEYIGLIEKLLYRGDASHVDKFDVEKTSDFGLYGKGIYLTSDDGIANDYTIVDSGAEPGRTKKEALRYLAYSRIDTNEYERRALEIENKYRREYNDLSRDGYSPEDVKFNRELADSLQSKIRTEKDTLSSEMFDKSVEALRRDMKKLRAIKTTTGMWKISVRSGTESISSFDFSDEYLSRVLDTEAPLDDRTFQAIADLFPEQGTDLRAYDERGNETYIHHIHEWVKSFKKYGMRYAWTERSVGGKGQNPSYDELMVGTHGGGHVVYSSKDKLKDVLKNLGYVGFKFKGGVMGTGTDPRGGGGRQHDVYVMWDNDAVAAARKKSKNAVKGEITNKSW